VWPAGISEGGQDVGVMQSTADQGLQSWGHLGGQGGVRDLHPTSTIVDRVKMISCFEAGAISGIMGHFWYYGTMSGIVGPFLVTWGHSGTVGQFLVSWGKIVICTTGAAIVIVPAGACIQGGSSIRGGVTSGVKAGSLIYMKPV